MTEDYWFIRLVFLVVEKLKKHNIPQTQIQVSEFCVAIFKQNPSAFKNKKLVLLTYNEYLDFLALTINWEPPGPPKPLLKSERLYLRVVR